MPPKRGAKAEAAPKAKPKAQPKEEPKAKAKARSEPAEEPKAKARSQPSAEPKASARSPPQAEAQPEEDYASWSTQKLKDKLKELGAAATGSKDILVDRIKALAPASPAPARGSPKEAPAKAAPKRPAPEPDEAPAKKGKTEAPAKPAGKKRDAGGEEKSAPPAAPVELIAPSQVYYEDGEFKVEYAKSSRSACKKCFGQIAADSLRIAKMVDSDKFDGKIPAWYHPSCLWAGGLLPRCTEMISGFSTIRPDDREAISKHVPSGASSSGEGSAGASDELQNQSTQVYEVLDALATLSDGQVKEMLELNGYPSQHVPGGVVDKRMLCADGIVFGATQMCQVCKHDKGYVLLHGESYRCAGWVNEFLHCQFKTQEPKRAVWKLTEAAKEIAKLKKMKLSTGTRLFAAKLGHKEESSASASSEQKKPPFLGMTFVVTELSGSVTKQQLIELIRQNGGALADSVSKATTCVVTTAEDWDNVADAEQEKAQEVPGVDVAFVTDSVEGGELVDMETHLLWGEVKRRKEIEETVTSKFIQKRGIAMDVDIDTEAVNQKMSMSIQTTHVLVDKQAGKVYSEMLNKTDMLTGGNSFYMLQLLEADAGGSFWLFRKWGRIGVSQGGKKLEAFGSNQDKAIKEFCKQYLDKSGNEFGLKGDKFVVKPGKMVRVEMDHKKGGKDSGTQAAGEGADDQPLGKLSKVQIEKGDKVLDEIEAALNEDAPSSDDTAKATRDAKFFSLSAQYYTYIPHNFGSKKPPAINNAEMHGAEKALLQFYLRMGFEEIGGEEDETLTPISGVMALDLPKSLADAAKPVCAMNHITGCLKKGAMLEKKKAGNPAQAMGSDLYGAILLYTANAIYKQLNKALRDENRQEVERYFPYLRMLFEACARLKTKKQTLWRGVAVDLFPSYKVGSTIVWWGVSSCTSVQKVAQDFMNGCGDGATLLTIETETACEISEVSFYANEAESILLPGTKLEVLKSERKGTKSEIHLREVGREVN